ncbi:MAG: DUF4398 domain-containing protein [Pseudomonadota bacterium]
MINRLLGCLAFLALAGCANDPAPSEQLRLTEQVVSQALAVGAGEQIAEMQLAQEKLAQAQAAMARQEFKAARMLAEQAELDARLAEARVLTYKSQSELTVLSADIKELRIQLGDLQ